MATKPVNIKRPEGQPCKVVPRELRASRPIEGGQAGDTVQFNAHQFKKDVTIRIHDKIFGVDPIYLNSGNGYKMSLPVKTDAPVGDHDFFVFLNDGDCKGGSPPKMIID